MQSFAVAARRRLASPPTLRQLPRQQYQISRPQARHITNPSRPPRQPQSPFSYLRQRLRARYNSTKPPTTDYNPTPNLGSPEPTTLSARLKKLTREYGWSALGVYLGLSALDFPFCFIAVRLLGTERIGYAEHVVVSTFWRIVEAVVPSIAAQRAERAAEEAAKVVDGTEAGIVEREGGADGWGVEQAQARNQGDNASLWTQLVLAYAIHKSFIFVRVPLTAAVTPKVVKTLRGWGWDIGKKRPKVPKSGGGKGAE